MADTQVRLLNDLNADVRRFTYLDDEGGELGEMVCDPNKFKGWDEIRWLDFPDKEKELIEAGDVRGARHLLIDLIEDWVTAQNPEWTPERILNIITFNEAYALCAFFAGRLRGAFATAQSEPEKRKTAASQTQKRSGRQSR